MARFRILHLSDLHFAARPNQVSLYDRFAGTRTRGWFGKPRLWRPSSHNSDIATHIARAVWMEAKNLDLLVITGDLATTGNERDLRAVLAYVDTPAQRGWQTASKASTLRVDDDLRIAVLPGNHDRYQYNHRVSVLPRSGGTRFDEIFESYWTGGRTAQLAAVLNRTGERDKLALIMTDLTLASNDDATDPSGVFGQGRVYDDVLNSLLEVTRDVREKYGPVGIVWLVHFAPNFANLRPSNRLLDEQLLLDAARDIGIRHIFCGHTHEARVYPSGALEGPIIHCAGTGCECSTTLTNCFHVRSIDVIGGDVVSITSRRFEWNDRVGDFVVRDES